MRRRKIIVTIVALLLSVSACMKWLQARRHDSRLVGRWLFTRGAAPTADELNWIPDQNSAGERHEWVFKPDGTGRQYSGEDLAAGTDSYLIFRWRTDGDRLWLKWGEPGSSVGALQEIIEDFRRSLGGQPPGIPQHEYVYTGAEPPVTGERQFVLHSQDARLQPPDDVCYLTRLTNR